jgi:hypothetical protein
VTWPVYDQKRDGPDVFGWILSAAATERARRRAENGVFVERLTARYRAQLDLARRLDEREVGAAE